MVLQEKEKNKVFVSSLFARHYPQLWREIKTILTENGIRTGLLYHTRDYWCRDYMPIALGVNHLGGFTYDPDYLRDQPKFRTVVFPWMVPIPNPVDNTLYSPIRVDGGNIVAGPDCVIMTEKVFAENPEFAPKKTVNYICGLLKIKRCHAVLIPWERKYDTFGHTDGMLRFAGTGEDGRPRLLVNLELYGRKYAERVRSQLEERFNVVDLQLSHYDELSWAYINALQTSRCIIVPGIGLDTDAEALSQYKKLYPEYDDRIYMVQMRDFIAQGGGALNCCTWTIKVNE